MLESLREFYFSGKTKPESFRRACLKDLQQQIIQKEDDLLRALHEDLGKPGVEAYASEMALVQSEIRFTLKNLHSWIKKRRVKTPLMYWPAKSHVLPSPKGVVFIMGPWNYPFQLLMAPFVGALAAGNCVVMKPSEFAPHTAKVIEEIVKSTFDKDHCRVVQGDGAFAEKLTGMEWDHIFFTGSTGVGRKVMAKAAENLTPVTLELGGKNPCIVCDDADIKVSAERIAWGKFFNAGQTCIAPDTLYCHENIADDLISELQDVIHRFYGADPEKSKDYGRIVNARHVKRLAAYLSGCNVVSGGKYDEKERYFAPTIMTKIPDDAPVLKEEIFGPVLPVLTYSNRDDLIEKLQKRARPLALYIFSMDVSIQEKLIQALPSGSVGINETLKQGTTLFLPFGGTGESGMGLYHGKASFDCFTHYKSIMKSGFKGSKAHYPPYKFGVSFMKKFLRFFG